jgi:hypothetical protein
VCVWGGMSVHPSMKIRNGTILVFSMLFSFVLSSQFLYYYYLNYFRLINHIYSWYSFLLEVESTPGPSAAGRIRIIEKNQ